jgi:hypothetical protein
MSVSEARRSWDAAGSSSAAGRDPFQLAEETLRRMSDAECDQVVAEQRRRKASKRTTSTPAVKQPAGKKITTISETTYPRGRLQ